MKTVIKSARKFKGKLKCPKGVICIENISLYVIIGCIGLVVYYLYERLKREINLNIFNSNERNKVDMTKQYLSPHMHMHSYTSDSVQQHDVLLNPYTPPLKDENYNVHYNRIRNSVNMSTNIGSIHNAKFRQIGLLSSNSSSSNSSSSNSSSSNSSSSSSGPVPLMGKPLYSNRNKWQYYTMSDQHNSVKLPIKVKGKSTMTEYGCDELLSGDVVYVEGIQETFTVTTYDNDHLQYLPGI